MKKQKKPWPLGRVIEVFLLVFGALTVAVPMFTIMPSMGIAMGAKETAAFSSGQIQGFLISGFGLMEAGSVMAVVRRKKTGKDISFAIGACIAILIVGILQVAL